MRHGLGRRPEDWRTLGRRIKNLLAGQGPLVKVRLPPPPPLPKRNPEKGSLAGVAAFPQAGSGRSCLENALRAYWIGTLEGPLG